MPEQRSRRRSSDQRNVLYDEPSTKGVIIAMGVIAAVIAVILILVFGDVLPSDH